MLYQAVILSLNMVLVINAFSLPHIPHKKEKNDPLVQKSIELQNALRNLDLNLTEYREQVRNLTEGQQVAVSSLSDVMRLLSEQDRQIQEERLKAAFGLLLTTIAEQERNLQEHSARQIEEFRRVNEQIMTAKQTLNDVGN